MTNPAGEPVCPDCGGDLFGALTCPCWRETCSLCGSQNPGGSAYAYDESDAYRLCHGDGDPRPTCYERWVMGERPGEAVKG